MYNKIPIIIFGLNDLAELSLYYFNNDTRYSQHYEVIGFTVNKKYNTTGMYLNLPVWDWEDLQHNDGLEDSYLFAPLISNNLRKQIYEEGLDKGFKFISYISSKCTNFSKSIGKNCFILEDNTIQPFVTIGDNVIIWSGSHIGHSTQIESNVYLTSQVVISGHCHIKEGAFIGVNSCLRDGITIGKNSVVGMGSVVLKSIPDEQTWIGNPAKLKL